MLIITGAEQGLGAQLLGMAEGPVMNLPRAVIREGKYAIDNWIDQNAANVDMVINNFGTNHLSWIGTTPKQDEDIILTNVMGPYWVINALVRNGNVCRVVNVASATHRVAQRCSTLYCASKAALVHMTRVMSRELAPKGWVINAVAPGAIEGTEMTRLVNEQVLDLRQWLPEQAEEYARSMVPCGRESTTEEVATAIFKLLAMPDYVNGTVLEIMGGV